MLRMLLEIYFGINLLISGFFYDELAYGKSIIQQIVYFILGFTLAFVFLLIGLINKPIRYVYNTFHLQFWALYFFTKKFKNLSEEELKNLNKWKAFGKAKNRLIDRIGQYCVDLVNRDNNYKP